MSYFIQAAITSRLGDFKYITFFFFLFIVLEAGKSAIKILRR